MVSAKIIFVFGNDQPFLCDFLLQGFVFHRVIPIQSGAQHGDGAASRFQYPGVGKGVDAAGQSGHHRQLRLPEILPDHQCGLLSVQGIAARPHHRHLSAFQQFRVSSAKELFRRIRNLPQKLRIQPGISVDFKIFFYHITPPSINILRRRPVAQRFQNMLAFNAFRLLRIRDGAGHLLHLDPGARRQL